MHTLQYNKKFNAVLAAFCGGRLPHAVLLEGPEGVGKKTAARQLVQLALCGGENPPCGGCTHCVKVEKGIHPDLRMFTVPEGKKEFPVDLVREIRQEAHILPNEAECKVYLLDCAHAMNTAAQNALLKLIEEPPPFVRFLLLCENRSLMLPTILSRVTSVELETPTVEQCVALLETLSPETELTARQAAAAGAGGNVGRALSLLGSAKPSKAAADARQLRQAMAEGDRYTALRLLAGYDKDRAGLSQMLMLLRESFARLAVARWQPDGQALSPALARVSPGQAIRAAQMVETAQHRAGRNVGVALLCACLVEDMRTAFAGD